MHTNSKLAKSIRLALMFGATATAMTGVANAQDQNEEEEAEEERVERIQVTGSRIQRTDMEGALPVTVIDREAIELSGEISAADLIRNTTFNTTGSFRPQSGSSAQGVSMVDLRGIGASRSLVLVDGRRLTMSPSTGSSQDLNSIPIAAIERIEILSDGASAVYGSDAIGGVINVITRRDFNGAELTYGEGGVSIPSEGGDRENASIVFGASSDSTSVIGGVSWNKREIVFENAYPWNVPGASTYGNNFINFVDGRTAAIPGGCTTENFYIASNGRCLYNFNATNANEASSSNESLFVKLRHDINDDWTLYSNASIAQTESFGRYAPVPDINHPVFYDNLLTPTDSYNNPTNPNAWFYDPNNPNAVVYDPDAVGPLAPVAIYHRFAAMGNRDNSVNNENLDLLVGVEGRAFGIDWDFGARSVRNKTYELGDGYLASQTAWTNVNNFNPGYCSDGSFNPEACRSGYNIQRPLENPDQVLSAGVVTTSRIGDFNIDEMYLSGAFDVMEIGGGMIQGFVGFETRDEFFNDQYDSQSEAGLVGGSSGNSAGGGRSVDAMYFEFLVPLTYDLELSVAGRRDKYSDYGSDFSPKVSFRWQPRSNVLVRGSYGEGFRAPTLDILTQKQSFSADSVTDEITCQALSGGQSNNCQINAFVIANPELESEKSKQFSFGTAFQATEWLSFAADYYSIEINNRIRGISSQALINAFRAGDPLPAGTEVNVNERNEVVSVVRGFVNEGDLETSGIDFNARLNFDFGGLGTVSSNFQVSHILDYSLDGGRNLVLDTGVPEQRANIQTQWNLNDFTVAWNVNMIGTQYTTVVSDPDASDGVARSGNVGTYTSHDLQLSYNTPWNGRITVGAQNLFEKLPKIGTSSRAGSEYSFGGRNYNFNLYNANGRFTYVRYTQTF